MDTHNHFDETHINRLLAIEGHVKAIREMILSGRSCEDIIFQMSAVESAMNKLGKIMLKLHLNTCVKEGIKEGNQDVLESFNQLLDKYLD